MSTPLQTIYDSFLIKIDEPINFVGMQEMIFNYFLSARAKLYKIIPHSLDYTFTVNLLLDGMIVDDLDFDEIELIALQMLFEHKRRKREYLEALKREIGTKDFNTLSDKKRELDGLRNGMLDLKEEINELKQQFNTYKFS